MGKKNKYRPKLNLGPGMQSAPVADKPTRSATTKRAITRLERLLAVHDAEVDKLLKGDVDKHRWLVSPSMVLRIQRELDELRQQLEELEFDPSSPEAKESRTQAGLDWLKEALPHQMRGLVPDATARLGAAQPSGP